MAFAVRPDGRVVESTDLSYSFELDRAFGPDIEQHAVYEEVGRPAVCDVLDGYNGTILAYGQTGSGKTHCMFGPDLAMVEHHGMGPRAAWQIFGAVRTAPANARFVLRCSLLEIYCEHMRDLLNPSNRDLRVQESPTRGIYVDRLSEACVSREEDVFEILQTGERMRAVACTWLNQHSSRSHVLFFLTCEQKLPDGMGKVGKLTLVDLAGSEKVGNSGALHAGGAVLKEAKTINFSLSALGHVIQALSEQRPHVPYRNSQLTRVLQETLGGNCKTTLLVTCSPARQHASETLSSLRFAACSRTVRNHVCVNVVRSREHLAHLAERLRRELFAARAEAAELGVHVPTNHAFDEPPPVEETLGGVVPSGESAGDSAGKEVEVGDERLRLQTDKGELQQFFAEDQEAALGRSLEAAIAAATAAAREHGGMLDVVALARLRADECSLYWHLAKQHHEAVTADAALFAQVDEVCRLEDELAEAWDTLCARRLLARRRAAQFASEEVHVAGAAEEEIAQNHGAGVSAMRTCTAASSSASCRRRSNSGVGGCGSTLRLPIHTRDGEPFFREAFETREVAGVAEPHIVDLKLAVARLTAEHQRKRQTFEEEFSRRELECQSKVDQARELFREREEGRTASWGKTERLRCDLEQVDVSLEAAEQAEQACELQRLRLRRSLIHLQAAVDVQASSKTRGTTDFEGALENAAECLARWSSCGAAVVCNKENEPPLVTSA